jgi:uroporphyrinogen decarboxylase
MGLGKLKEAFGGRASFFGALDTQGVLPFGTEMEVEQEVRRVIAEGGKGGGLLLAGAHNLQPDVSVSKVRRIFETVHRYGRYPLRG